MASRRSSKDKLRWSMRGRRLALAAASPSAAAQAARAAPLGQLRSFRIVSGYHPIGSEMDPGPLMSRLAEAGCKLALPVAIGKDSPLQFRSAVDAPELVCDVFGIPSPPEVATMVIPDLVIAPVLAFDRSGARLGQGGGLFDRTLALLRSSGNVFVLGLAYEGQRVDSVPAEPHDEPLDAILTERGYTEFLKASRCG